VAVAANDEGVYVADREGIVWRIDPVDGRVVGRIGVSGDVQDLALGFGSVWLADGTDGTVTRIDHRLSGSQTIPLGPPSNAPAFWIATGGGAVWVTHGDFVEKIDPVTNHVVKTIAVPSPAGLASGFGAVWVATGQRLDRVTAAHRPIANQYPLPGLVEAPTVGRHSAWSIVYHGNGEVWEFGRRLTAAGPAGIVDGSVGRYPLDLAVADGAVWTVDTRGVVSRIDPAALRVVRTIRTAPTIRSSLAVGNGDLWVAVQGPR
jgi:streptogramin lyase